MAVVEEKVAHFCFIEPTHPFMDSRRASLGALSFAAAAVAPDPDQKNEPVIDPC